MTRRAQIFVKGDVVLAPFPFTDVEIGGKTRPGLVIAALADDTSSSPTDQILILCAITSHAPRTAEDLRLTAAHFQEGRPRYDSTIRVSRLWTISSTRIERRIGQSTVAKLSEVVATLNAMLAR